MSDRDRSWMHPRLEIRPSRIQGNGVFAREPLEAGEIVVRIGGVVMSEAEFRAFASEHARYSAIQLAEDLHLVEEADITAQAEGSLNHSCEGNLWMQDPTTLCTLRAIRGNEELTVDYALFSVGDEDLIGGPCRCGTPLCRAEIRGTDWTRSELQDRYRDHFSPFIGLRIKREAT